MSKYKIVDQIDLDTIQKILENDLKIELSNKVINRVNSCRKYLDNKVKESEHPIYGINTGFGSLHNVSISNSDLGELQENLVKSHACGTGEEVPKVIVKLMLLLKIQGLSYGHSGIALDTLKLLVKLFNENIIPVVYQLGSLGASGDLAPLAHLSLPLLGMGEVYHGSKKRKTTGVFKKLGIKTVKLKSKEGLALLNGTQFMSAYSCWIGMKAKQLLNSANCIAALSLDGFDGRIEPFDDLLHQLRNHHGQISVASDMRGWLKGSKIIKQKKEHVQDPYSFRCIPQVHGASLDALVQFEKVINCEINAVTDNPTVFWKENKIISGGNFHGQPLALSLDFLSIALAEIGSISERRIYKLLDGQRELPSYLVSEPGLNSGMMIVQYSAASVASQNKQLCQPCSVDSIDSSQGQEDHVSMGANSATKTFRILENVKRILSMELMVACQALEFRRPLNSSSKLEKVFADFRQDVPFVKKDVEMYILMQKSLKKLEEMLPEL